MAQALGEVERLDRRDWYLAVRAGQIPGWRSVRKFGVNAGVPSGAYEAVWSGSTLYPFQSTFTTLSVVSGDPADGTANSTGAQVVTFAGIDSNWNWASEQFTLAGTAAVVGTTTFARVFRGRVDRVGTYGQSNIGTITASINSTAVAIIEAGVSQTEMAVWSNASNGNAYLKYAYFTVDGTRQADLRIRVRENAHQTGTNYGAVRTVFNAFGMVSPGRDVEFVAPLVVPAYSDVWVEAQGSAGAGVSVTADFDAYYIDS